MGPSNHPSLRWTDPPCSWKAKSQGLKPEKYPGTGCLSSFCFFTFNFEITIDLTRNCKNTTQRGGLMYPSPGSPQGDILSYSSAFSKPGNRHSHPTIKETIDLTWISAGLYTDFFFFGGGWALTNLRTTLWHFFT